MPLVLLTHPITLPAGTVIEQLTPDEIRRRPHRLARVGVNQFQLTEDQGFKAGTCLSLPDSLLKGLGPFIELLDGATLEDGTVIESPPLAVASPLMPLPPQAPYQGETLNVTLGPEDSIVLDPLGPAAQLSLPTETQPVEPAQPLEAGNPPPAGKPLEENLDGAATADPEGKPA